MIRLSIEEYFRYHPPLTDERKQKHDALNAAALEFAKVIDSCVVDEDCKKMGMFAVQQARMFANQGITVDELVKLKSEEGQMIAIMPDHRPDPNWLDRLRGDVVADEPET
jgi:hypothetical protein